MENPTQNQLMKYFSLRLKRRTSEESSSISPKILPFLSRKDLVNSITYRYQGKLPPGLDLVEMENEELLTLIGDELYIMAYMLQKWCLELQEQVKLGSSKPVPLDRSDSKQLEQNEVSKPKEEPSKAENRGVKKAPKAELTKTSSSKTATHGK